MAEPWVPLLGASVLIAIGFLAAQVFERFRLPDYVILIAVGIALGSGVLPLGAWSPAPLLVAGQPFLLSVAIAFILFEGGLGGGLRRSIRSSPSCSPSPAHGSRAWPSWA